VTDNRALHARTQAAAGPTAICVWHSREPSVIKIFAASKRQASRRTNYSAVAQWQSIRL